MKLLVGIPAYNEAPNLAPLMQKFEHLFVELQKQQISLSVCVVNDCSQDNTKQLVEQWQKAQDFSFDLQLINHEKNLGLAGALETIWSWGQSHEQQSYIGLGILDGDDSQDPQNFLKMIPRIQAGSDVVIASRYRSGSEIYGLANYRKALSRGMSMIFCVLGRISGVRDYSCGFRLYSSFMNHSLVNLKLKYRSFACMVELLKRCSQRDIKITEVPFILRYDLKQGESKMNFKRTITETLKVLFDKQLA